MIRDHRPGIAGLHRETAARIQNPGVEAVIVGNDMMQNLVIIVNRHGLPGLRMNRARHEHVMLQNRAGNRAAILASRIRHHFTHRA